MSLFITSNSSSQAFLEIIPVDACVRVLSFLDYPDLNRFFSTCKRGGYLREASGNYAERVSFSRVQIFDRVHWKQYRNAEITEKYEPFKIEIRTLRAFLKCYWGPNPVGPGRVKDHCLIPTVQSAKVKIEGVTLQYCLNVAEDLAKRPKEGSAAKFRGQTDALKLHGNEGTENDELVIYLKKIQARGKSWKAQVAYLKDLNDRTRYGCVEPDLLSQVTVSFAHYQLTGERPFGDHTGMEKEYTYGRTSNEVLYGEEIEQAISGGFGAGQALNSGDLAPAELDVDDSSYDMPERYGVYVVRKF